MRIPEKICLLQISTPAGDELIDPLAGINLGPLLEAFGQHELICCMGRIMTLRLLSKHHDFVPRAPSSTPCWPAVCSDTASSVSHISWPNTLA